VLARPGVRSQPPHPLHSHVRSRSRQRARALPSELARPDLARSRRSMTSERAQARRTDVCSPHSFVVKDEQRSCVSCHYRFHYSELSPVSLPDGVPRFTASTPRFGGLSAHAVERCLLAPHPENRTSDAPSLPRPPRPLQALPPNPSSSLPPHLRVDVRFVPSQDAFHQQDLPERERPRTRVTRCRLE
jgi:hypothetical protein